MDILRAKKEKFQADLNREKEIANTERMNKLRKIMKVSDSIKIPILANLLEMTEENVWDYVYDWADQFDFRIKEDLIVFGQGDMTAFLKELDKAFSTWGDKEKNKDGKMEK